MRSLTLALALALLLAPSAWGQGGRISGPINKARSAAAAASARTERQQREGLAPQNIDSTAKAAAGTTAPAGTAAKAPAPANSPSTRPATGVASTGPQAGKTAATTAQAPAGGQAGKTAAGTPPASGQGGPVARQTTAAATSAGKTPPGGANPPTAAPRPAPTASPAKTSGPSTAPPRGVTPNPGRPSTTVESAGDTARAGAALAQPRPDVSISREVFQYDPAGRRDPFVSLLTTDDLRPLFTDLVLVGVAHDRNPRNSVALMRDVKTKEQYRARVGQLVGRMRVSSIDRKQVVFTIEEFGFSRQETLVLGDTSKVRKQ